jgi:2-octaprenylphenol hydroxylase
MPDITVAGAGFVGLSFAIAASQRGFDVAVYDRKKRPVIPTALSSNVIAVNPASSAFLEDIGAWQKMADEFVTPYSAMSVFDGTGSGAISFTAQEADLQFLGHIVDQGALLAALAETGEAQDRLALHWETEADFSPGDVPLLVGADGVHSKIREAVGLKTVGFEYNQSATVCIARMEEPHGGVARQWFLETGPLAFLPLGEPNAVAVVWSSFDDLAACDDEDFGARLQDASEACLGSVGSLTPRFAFPLRQQQALRYVAEGVALLGDAAHAIHPLAGQGANLGFADARVLVTEIGSAKLEGRSPGDINVLRRYEQQRKVENWSVGAAMEGFHRLFTAKLPVLGLLRSRGLRFVDSNRPLKKLAMNIAAGKVG